MKKFFPIIAFIFIFLLVLTGQVAYKKIRERAEVAESKEESATFEKLFLHANYKTMNNQNIEMTKIDAPVVIFNFWASWCLPCLEEMPSMLALKKRFPDDLVKIVSINTDVEDQEANVKRVIQKINLKDEFIIVPDRDSNIIGQFKIAAIPVTIIFHRGKVVHMSNGPMDFNSEEIAEKMKKWVKM